MMERRFGLMSCKKQNGVLDRFVLFVLIRVISG